MKLLVTVIALTLGPTCFADDWPMGGRSQSRNPVSPERNAPTDLSNIRWTAKLGSRTLGGPVVSGGLVWVGTNNETDFETEHPDYAVLACFRESDGKLLYRYLSKRIENHNHTWDWPKQALSGSPVIEGDRLWFITNRREAVCLDVGPLRRGEGEPKMVWSVDLIKEYKIHPRAIMIPGPDTFGSPAIHKDFIYLPTGNGMNETNDAVPSPNAPSLICLDKNTGKHIWSDKSVGKNMMFGHYSSPLVVEQNGKAQVIFPQADGWVRSFDAATGEIIWKFDVNPKAAKGDYGLGAAWGTRLPVHGIPVFANGRIFFAVGVHPEACGSDPGRIYCLDPAKRGDVSEEVEDGPGRGKLNPNSAVVWKYTNDEKVGRLHMQQSSVEVHDGLVYTCDHFGVVHCLDEKTGRRNWFHEIKDGQFFSSPLVTDNKVYIAGASGELVILEAGKMKRLIGKLELESAVYNPLVFANGTLYIPMESKLMAVAKGGK